MNNSVTTCNEITKETISKLLYFTCIIINYYRVIDSF